MVDTLDGLKSFYDVVVVGARCAGAATGMLLARAGANVLVVEQAAPGTDTLSTHALMRAGVLQLARWGLLDAIRAVGTPPIEWATFHYEEQVTEVRIKPRDGVDALYAPRRTVLDPILARAANDAGAEIIYRTRVRRLQRDSTGRIAGVVVESGAQTRAVAAALVVGADGVHSTVATDLELQAYELGSHVGGVIFTRASGLPVNGYHWHYAPGVSVGVIPTNGGETLVFVETSRLRFMRELRFDLAAGFDRVLREAAPSLAAAVAQTSRSTFRGFAGHPGFLRPAFGPGWALVGDAGYFKDPITAHGITDALRDAELLARAVIRGTEEALKNYQMLRDDLSVPLLKITDEIASFAWTMPRLQALHKALSDEMAREVLHVVESGTEGAALSDLDRGARDAVQRDYRRLQSTAR